MKIQTSVSSSSPSSSSSLKTMLLHGGKMSALERGLKENTIEKLTLSGNDFTCRQIQLLCKVMLQKGSDKKNDFNSSLQELTVGPNLKQEHLECILQYIPKIASSLKCLRLELGSHRPTVLPLSMIMELQKCQSLETLHIHDTWIETIATTTTTIAPPDNDDNKDPNTIIIITTTANLEPSTTYFNFSRLAAKLPNLQQFSMTSCNLYDNHILELYRIMKHVQLEKLVLDGNPKITKHTLGLICDLKVQVLSLESCSIDSIGLASMLHVLQEQQHEEIDNTVQHLYLSNNPKLAQEGLSFLNFFEICSFKLSSLNVSFCGVSEFILSQMCTFIQKQDKRPLLKLKWLEVKGVWAIDTKSKLYQDIVAVQSTLQLKWFHVNHNSKNNDNKSDMLSHTEQVRQAITALSYIH